MIVGLMVANGGLDAVPSHARERFGVEVSKTCTLLTDGATLLCPPSGDATGRVVDAATGATRFELSADFPSDTRNYLLDDSGLINIRNKQVAIPLMDPEKVAGQKMKWQLVNIGVPVGLIILLGGLFNWFRRRAYR